MTERDQKTVTAAQIAKMSGVSKWTVIRAFQPDGVISEKTRRKVLEIAEQLDYRPNLLARSLATRKSQQIAILLDDFGNPYKMPTLERITSALQKVGVFTVLVNVSDSFRYTDAISSARQRLMDAIVLFGGSIHSEQLSQSRKAFTSQPFIILARDSAIPGIPAITCDSEHAMHEISTYLTGRGYRRACYLAGPENVSNTLSRYTEFARRWSEAGRGPVETVFARDYSYKAGAAAARDYLTAAAAGQRCDVLVCENDILAMGAMDVISAEFGLRIPQDIAVVGFDGIDLAQAPSVSLTTFRQPSEEMADALIDMILGKRPLASLHMRGTLIPGATA